MGEPTGRNTREEPRGETQGGPRNRNRALRNGNPGGRKQRGEPRGEEAMGGIPGGELRARGPKGVNQEEAPGRRPRGVIPG